MVIDAGLSEKSNILEALVILDDVVKVGMTFTADVWEVLDLEAKLGCVLRAAFGIDPAVLDDWLKPVKVFTVMCDDDLEVQIVSHCRRGGSPGRQGCRRRYI